MSIRLQIQYWIFIFLTLLAALWLLSDVLAPFLLGAAIAYITDPLADRLEAKGFPRLLATIFISILFFSTIGLMFFLLLPPFINQLTQFLDDIPEYMARLQVYMQYFGLRYFNDAQAPQEITQQALEKLESNFEKIGMGVLKETITNTTAVVSGLGVFLITPVVAFYLLLDWDKLIAHIKELLPRQYAQTICSLSVQADHVLASFVRGQMLVCLILASFYSIALTLVGLKFGLFVGLFAGFLSFIPFLGSLVGLLLSVGLAIAQFGSEYVWIAAVAGIFLFGQFVEGNILSPKIVGNSVQLHPVWLIFALSAFGSLMGFTGLLIAVPAAAVIGVLTRFALTQYKSSLLYKGADNSDGVAVDGDSPKMDD
jgi:predicted PurR-regulated permease PerM